MADEYFKFGIFGQAFRHLLHAQNACGNGGIVGDEHNHDIGCHCPGGDVGGKSQVLPYLRDSCMSSSMMPIIHTATGPSIPMKMEVNRVVIISR